MATSTGTTERINVRSPFYVNVDSTGAPTSPTDPTPVEPLPDEYNPPATVTQVVSCPESTNQVVNIANDAGTRIYRIDTSGTEGNLVLTFEIKEPIKISHQFSTESSPTVVGYRGDDAYEQDLIALGIPPSELTPLGDYSSITITIAIPSSHATTGHFDLTIEAPLRTDRYKITFGCPTVIKVSQTLPSPPSSVPANTYNLVSGTDAMMVKMYPSDGTGKVRYAENPSALTLKIYVDGTVVKTISASELNFASSDPSYIVFSNQASTKVAGTNIVAANASSSSISKNTENTIGFEFNQYVSMPKFESIITQLFENSDTTTNQWADPYKMYTYDFYSYADRNAVEAALTSTPLLIPRISNRVHGDSVIFEANKIYGFYYSAYFHTNGLGGAASLRSLSIDTKAEEIEFLSNGREGFTRDGVFLYRRNTRTAVTSGFGKYYDLG